MNIVSKSVLENERFTGYKLSLISGKKSVWIHPDFVSIVTQLSISSSNSNNIITLTKITKKKNGKVPSYLSNDSRRVKKKKNVNAFLVGNNPEFLVPA